MNKIIKDIINKKKSSICLSADLDNTRDILNLARRLGSKICILKIHCDIINDYNCEFLEELKEVASISNFLLMEDRKFSDIGSIVKKQYEKYIDFDLVTVHTLAGEGTIKAISEVMNNNKTKKTVSGYHGILLVAQMSSEGNLLTCEYKNATIELGKKYKENVCGFICQEKLCENFLHFSPGINILENKDILGQKYITPSVAKKRGVDVIIVGRGLYQQKNPEKEIIKYINDFTQD